MTKPFPDFTLYIKAGIEGAEDSEVSESVVFAYDESLTDEQNAMVISANASLAQVRLQKGIQTIMQDTLPAILEARAKEQGIDFDPNSI